MVDSIAPAAAAAAAGSTASGGGGGSGLTALADRDTFLKLLVAQVQNQDPLTPQEPVEFVSQLAQFSSLETMLSMRTSLENIELFLAAMALPADDPAGDPDPPSGSAAEAGSTAASGLPAELVALLAQGAAL
jgi:flagellar hook assembly protein FlgD